tara:strand:- start:40 stop:459 length:420 start_codon:yes stop_codon:yes gene_type:complete
MQEEKKSDRPANEFSIPETQAGEPQPSPQMWAAHQQAFSYTRAEASKLLEGAVTEEIYGLRKSICMSCDHRKDSPEDEIGFCKSCGCGENQRSKLTVKLTMPKVKCPLNKWGTSKGKRVSLIKKMRVSMGKKLLGIKDA